MTDLVLKLSTPGQLLSRVLPYFPGSVQGAGGIAVTVSGNVYTVAPQSGSVVSTMTGNTWSALQTFSAGITVNGTASIVPSGLQQALNVTQNPSGTASNPSWNIFNIAADLVDAGSGFSTGVAIIQGFGTSTAKGGRQAISAVVSLNSATNSGNTNRNYVGGVFIGQAQASDGGGSGTEKGAIFGLNSVGQLLSGTFFTSVKSYEADVAAVSGTSVLDKYGIHIAQLSNDAVAGSRNDAALAFANQSGAVGWGTLIQIGDTAAADNPLKTTGTILGLKSSPTIANGIDLSGAGSITGNAFASPSFSVNGGGVVTGAALVTGDFITTAPTTLTGTSGTLNSMSQIINSSGTFTLTLPSAAANGGRWLYVKNIISTNAVNSASSNVVPIGSATAGTAILAAGTTGKWAILQSDATNWITMAAN